MKSLVLIAAVALILNQVSANSIPVKGTEASEIVTLNLNADNEVQKITQAVFNHISSEGDTQLQSEAKAMIAQYLVEASMEAVWESDNGRQAESPLIPIAYGKHHSSHHDWWHQQQAQVPAAVPAVAAVQAIPVATQQAPAPVQVSTNEVRQDVVTQRPVTQIPIIVPAGSGDAAVPVGSSPVTSPAAVPAAPVAPVVPVAAPVPAPAALTTPAPRPTAPTVDPVHHLNQVNKILGNVANGNIVGIVDESLAIRAPPPVRNLVTNIMKVIFCNPIDRILRRCSANQVAANNNSAKGK